jgi:predicted DNA-binding transcriptional regulator AlpA
VSNTRRSRTARTTNASTDTAGVGGQVWTADKIRALGASTDLTTAAQIFGLSPATAYRLIKRDAFPVPVIRAGGHYRVPVAPILAALQLAPDPDTGAPP